MKTEEVYSFNEFKARFLPSSAVIDTDRKPCFNPEQLTERIEVRKSPTPRQRRSIPLSKK